LQRKVLVLVLYFENVFLCRTLEGLTVFCYAESVAFYVAWKF